MQCVVYTTEIHKVVVVTFPAQRNGWIFVLLVYFVLPAYLANNLLEKCCAHNNEISFTPK